MFVRYDKELIPYQGRLAPVQSVAWSPDSSRLAVCNSDNVIFLYDESGEKRDKFNTKSVDSKGEKLSYVVKGIVFSPDSTKLAVGQSDCSVFVYRLGQRWSDRKVICNKFLHKGPVTCLLWPSEQRIVVGSLEGRVRLANPKTNKCSTMYNTGVMVTSLASCDDQGFLSGHADGSIVMYAYQGASSSAARKFCSHSVAPYVLLWSQNTLIAAGSDRRVLVYDADGNLFQQLNYANESTDREVSSAALSPGGQSVALGSYDKFRTYSWSNKKSGWVEGDLILVKNMYTITAMSWKSDSSKIAIGGLCGAVELFDCCLKQLSIGRGFDVSYTGYNQILVKSRKGTERLTLRSRYADEISDVRVLGNDRFVVAKCRNSLLIGDMFSGKFSEILWQSAGNEKFYFEFENACLIFNAGELTVVEYGCNEPLISLKMNTMNPHVISVRINERLGVQVGQVKFMAYAVDPKLIAVVNLSNGSNVAQLSLDHAADWLELNETAKFLLWRDKRRQLFLQDLEIGSKVALLCQCEFVQWVPGSDVIVAQSYGNLCVWYDIRGSTDATVTPIKGEAVQIVRQDGKTFVVIESKSGVYEHELDENMVEFQTAIEDKDFKRAVKYLEGLTGHVEVASMWRQLAQVALQEENLNVAQRCFAATRDVPRVRYILETKNLAARLSDGAVNKGLEHYRVRARIALMRKDFAAAVQFYLNENALDEALEMYLSLHKWEDAIDLAEKQRYSELGSLKERYMNYLMENRRYDDAARVRENEGNFEVATELYLKASLPLKAMKVLLRDQASIPIFVTSRKRVFFQAVLPTNKLALSVIDKLIAIECYEQRHEKVFHFVFAMSILHLAVRFCRDAFPEEVIKVEEEWGDHLVDQGCTDVAVNHYIESGAMGKALDAAVHSQQWQKALDISQTLENGPTYASQFCQIADHMATLGKYEVCATAIFVTFKSWRLQIAERLYLSAGQQTRSVDMYNKAKMYEDAYRVACKCLNDDELNDRFLEEAGKLEKSGRLKDAEKLYCAMQQPNHAIAMYKNAGQHDSMMRLIEQFHPEHLTNAYVHVAQEMEEEGRFKDAESYYLLANAWKPVVKMYRAVGQWEDAYRIAKEYGGSEAAVQLAFLWASTVRGEAAVMLLQKLDCADKVISFACDHSAFDFAEEVCKLGFNSKLSEVHYKHGLRLEEHDDLEMAEIEFIKADNPKEAVLMYVQRQDWDNARRVAEKHCPAEISEILIGQARELNLWAEALRVARDYLPSQLAALQDEYDALQLSSGPKDVGAFLAQANNWEKQGEYERAVQCYLKITPELTNDAMLLEKSWLRAADIAAKFLEPSAVWLKQIAGCLVTIQRYRQAAELFLQCNEPKEAVDCLMNDSNFEEAKQVAIDYAPELSQYIEQRYKSYLKQQGKADLLANVDLNSAIEVFASRGDWSGALSLAKQRNNTELVNKYALLVLRKQLDNGDYLEAMQTLHNNDLSLTNEVLDMAKTVINAIFDRRLLWDQKGYSTYAALRNYLNDLTKGMSSPPSDEDQVEFFERCLDAAHYQANRIAISFAANDKEVQMVSLKISFSLLRYSDILPADRVFYEAGMAAMKMGGRYANAAFVFLNHFLDICEAVEVNDPSLVEYGDFDGTDIPCPSPLPKTLFASESEQEEVKEWILAASVDKEIKRELPTDDRGVYEACLVNADNSLSDPCILTGYPVIGPRKAFPNATFFANRKDWDKIVMSSKVARSSAMDDMIQYIENWS
ncbi:WD domain, G-beta repeat protein [Trichuris suis]|nr:WD domain, G-beta repeat protein [Trichuris suis]